MCKHRKVNAIWFNDPFEAEGVDSPNPQTRSIDPHGFYALLNFIGCAMGIGDGCYNPLVRATRELIGKLIS
jgi:hypothetical protein